MKLFGFEFGRRPKRQVVASDLPRQRIPVSGGRSYDAAATSRHNKNHWLYADSRDADSLITADLATLRNRARYEIRNNSYAKGIVDTRANDLVGTGPRLQVNSGDDKLDNELEDKFIEWAGRCDIEGIKNLADILRLTGSLQQDESGESLIVLTSSPAKKNWITATPDVRLQLQVIEPDRLSSPLGLTPGIALGDDKLRNGIEYDEHGKPLYYYILKKHPGSTYASLIGITDYEKIPASHVIHLYRQDRPGQGRGVPRITPALPLFAYLRRYTLATIDGAEQAANISAVLELSETEGVGEDEITEMDEIEIPRNAMLTTPYGAKMNQFKPEQPTGTYAEFKHEIINEIARCLNMPFNVAAANSSDYNYASGRLDWQVYYRAIRTDRKWIESCQLNRIFQTWLAEAVLVPGYLKLKPKSNASVKCDWFWPGAEHVDPVKEAVAQKWRFANMTTNLSIEYALQGRDWKRQLTQRKKEIDWLVENGMLDEQGAKKEMENIARAVRAGVPVAVSEARSRLGFPENVPSGKLLEVAKGN